MPVTLSTLFTSPQEIWDVLSTEGVDLRQDDHNQATGQIIQTSADSLAGATTMTVVPLPVALLRGALLEFDSAGMTVPIQVALSAAASAGATSISVGALTADIPSAAQARDSGVNAATGARLLVAARKGTSKVKLYCNKRYDDAQIALCGSARDWATDIAVRWICRRRNQPVPKSVQAAYEEALDELREVHGGRLALEDVGTRGADWPTISNITVRPSYNGMQARVEPNISEASPTVYGQYIDWNSAASLWI